ncbi:MAG: AAA family ATPase [Methylococcales bacterium]
MYLQFYGLNRQPFSITPEPTYLFPGQPHIKAWSVLEYGLSNRSGIIVLAGEVGSGKTTLVKRLINETENQLTVGLISNTHKSMKNLINWVLIAFNQLDNEGSQAAKHKQFQNFLEQSYQSHRPAILIVDEAQNLCTEALEELRLLHNINAENKMLLQLVLVGQPPLLDLLKQKELSQLVQRVSVGYHLKSLNIVETVQYIQYRLTNAGGNKDIFSHHASATIFYYSGGIPRIINALCDLALAYGYSLETPVIDTELVLEVIKSKHEIGLFPALKEPNEEAIRARQLVKEKANIDIGLVTVNQSSDQSNE